MAMFVGNNKPVGLMILVGPLLCGIATLCISQVRDPWASGALLYLAGMVSGLVASLVVAGLQEESHAEYRGRVMGMYTIASQAVPALSGVLAGALSHFLGVINALVACGCLICFAALINLTQLKTLRCYMRRETQAAVSINRDTGMKK